MDEEGLEETANKKIHIGKPIDFDENKFLNQLEELKVLCYDETVDIRKVVQEMVSTYHPKTIEAKKADAIESKDEGEIACQF